MAAVVEARRRSGTGATDVTASSQMAEKLRSEASGVLAQMRR